jgi:chromosome segregation ATPase
MYLKRITINGFKSFANKTVIKLEPGITAIVGPNGSGKSNVADAVRWAMGEQSKAKLRLSDREEIVFAGSDKRARASVAEVTLVFDNSDGVFGLELSEIEIGRRLYRSGETDYRLAGRTVRLSEIQLLLAQAQVGAGSYAVIGQGMIDGMLMAGPVERKLLFDEASGIRGDELKREAAMKRLSQTEANLTRLRDIRSELEPRLSGLERVATAAKRRQQLETEIARDRAILVVTAKTALGAELDGLSWEQTERAATRKGLLTRERELVAQLDEQQAKARSVQDERLRLAQEVTRLEAEWDTVMTKLSERQVLDREVETIQEKADAAIEEARKLQLERRQLERKQKAVERELAGMRQAVARSEAQLDKLNIPVKEAQKVLVALRHQTDSGTQQQYISHALNIVKVVAQSLTDEKPSIEQVKLLVHKAGRLLSHAAQSGEGELMEQLDAARLKLEKAMARRETVTEHLANVTLSVRSLELDLGHYEQQLTTKLHEQSEIEARYEAAKLRLKQLQSEQKASRHLDANLESATRAVTAAREALAQISDQGAKGDDVVQLATELERTRASLEQLAARHSQTDAQIKIVKDETKRFEQLAKAWKVVDQGVKPGTAPLMELESKLQLLEARYEAERTVQQEGEAEYTSVKNRYDELVTQIADLEAAQGDLRTVVERLEESIRTSFETGFATISKHFSTYFERLMDGGQAALKLERNESGDYGIEIKASPKGKRLANLNSLSGGERSLTGVALLAAILATNPCPFIVLDEIDAALDEANSSRLAAILKDLSKHAQLIVITHNRQTMAAAKVLFGVTLSDNHVSRLLSLRLEAARELAAR